MSCFPCFSSQKSKKGIEKTGNDNASSSSSGHRSPPAPKSPEASKPNPPEEIKDKPQEGENIDAQSYNFRELATATKNFRQECLLGEGGFGKVFKATLQSDQVVAVKQLDRNGMQGNKEFLSEVKGLSLLNHPNLVKFNGYCADGDQRILVYEYMPGGSLEDRLFDIKEDQKPLDWFVRIKIASGVAKGLEYLHDQADPPIIFRDLKASNILLDEDFNTKLSDFGLATLGSSGDKSPLPSRVMGTYGYSAPECTSGGQVTSKSDIYSFGVVMLELITGRKALDTTKPSNEQNIVTWAQAFFRDPKRFPDLADPLLGRLFPEKDLNQAVAVTAMCLQEEAEVRPLIADVVTALSFLSTVPDENLAPLPYPPEPEPEPEEDDGGDDSGSDYSSDSDTESRKIGKDRDGTSGDFTSARNHDTDSSDDEEEEGINSSMKKPKNKESEQKRVVFKDDVQPPPNHTRKNSSSSSDGGSPRSSNASENNRIDSLQSRDSEGGGDSSFKLRDEPSDGVNRTDSSLEHMSSRKSNPDDGGSEAHKHYGSDSDGGSDHGD